MHKSFIYGDLLAYGGAGIYPQPVPRTFRQRLGERYVVHRNTVAKLSVEKAKKKLKRDRSVVSDIESGQGNPGIAMYEDYAVVLGTTFEAMCFEAMADVPRQLLDPDERIIVAAYQEGTTSQREAIRALVRVFRPDVGFPPASGAPPATPAGDPRPVATLDVPARIGRDRR